jgi:membrane-associated phospholipid phosphatase
MIKSESFMKDFSAFGGLIFYLSLLFVTFFYLPEIFLKLLLGFMIIMGLGVVIRLIYFKNRPHKEKHHNFIEKIDASSFPSLHTARIVLIGLTLINFDLRLSYLMIPLILGTSYARIYLRRHDLVDVLGGAVLGIITFFLLLF